MENSIIASFQGKKNYNQRILMPGAVGVALFCMSFWIDYMLITDQVYKPDVLSVFILDVCIMLFGIHLMRLAYNFYLKHKKSLSTFVTIREETVGGTYNGIQFSVDMKNVISTSIQTCSLMVTPDGTPHEMNPNIIYKSLGATSKYLCIFTSTGKTYYIDCLEAPETAKNTIDSLIEKNNLNRLIGEKK